MNGEPEPEPAVIPVPAESEPADEITQQTVSDNMDETE